MIVNRGATQAALERWNERRRRIFYPKTEFDFGFKDLNDRKEQLKALKKSDLARILDQEIGRFEFLPHTGTLHAVFRLETATERYFLKVGVEEADFGFAIEDWVMRQIQPRL